MVIQIDSREKQRAITKVVAAFDQADIKHFTSKLWVGDYQALENPMIVVDRKQNLLEVANNVCQDHQRFRAELIRAQEAGIKVVILVEHGHGIESIQDVVWWDNPRRHKRIRIDGRWQDVETKAIDGMKLAKIMGTLEERYGCRFVFCDKEHTGERIIQILSQKNDNR